MYKVLLIDDEPWVLKVLELLVDWEKYGFEIVEKKNDGVSAWEYLKNSCPDAVVSDIRMPGLDGLSLLEKIHKEKLPTKVILISGYSEFEYARKAVKFGAFDYLVKPVEKDIVTNVLVNLKKVLDKKKQDSKSMENSLENYYGLLSLDGDVTVREFLKNHKYEVNYSEYVLLYSRNLDISKLKEQCSLPNMERMIVQSIQVGKQDHITLLGYDKDSYEKIMDCVEKIRNDEDERIIIGSSYIAGADDDFHRLYEMAQTAFFSELLSFTNQVRIYEKHSYQKEMTKLINKLGYAFNKRDTDGIEMYLDQIKRYCEDKKLLSDEILAIYNEIAMKCNAFLSPGQSIEIMNYRWFIGSYKSIDEVFDSLKKNLQVKEEVSEVCTNSIVNEVLDEVKQNYTDNISLHEMAQDRNVSQGYLSNLIKKESGMTFSQHLTRLRINKSKEKLTQTNLSILEVAELVGYSDYYYFIKVFKKEVGITPFQFKKMNRA